MQETGSALYIGGLYSSATADYLNGHVYDNWTTTVNNVCFQVSNVASFP